MAECDGETSQVTKSMPQGDLGYGFLQAVSCGKLAVGILQAHVQDVVGDSDFEILPEATLQGPHANARHTTYILHVDGVGIVLFRADSCFMFPSITSMRSGRVQVGHNNPIISLNLDSGMPMASEPARSGVTRPLTTPLGKKHSLSLATLAPEARIRPLALLKNSGNGTLSTH